MGFCPDLPLLPPQSFHVEITREQGSPGKAKRSDLEKLSKPDASPRGKMHIMPSIVATGVDLLDYMPFQLMCQIVFFMERLFLCTWNIIECFLSDCKPCSSNTLDLQGVHSGARVTVEVVEHGARLLRKDCRRRTVVLWVLAAILELLTHDTRNSIIGCQVND